MSGKTLNYKKHVNLQIGQHCLVHEEEAPRNSDQPEQLIFTERLGRLVGDADSEEIPGVHFDKTYRLESQEWMRSSSQEWVWQK